MCIFVCLLTCFYSEKTNWKGAGISLDFYAGADWTGTCGDTKWDRFLWTDVLNGLGGGQWSLNLTLMFPLEWVS